jgi:hypothetical protein
MSLVLTPDRRRPVGASRTGMRTKVVLGILTTFDRQCQYEDDEIDDPDSVAERSLPPPCHRSVHATYSAMHSRRIPPDLPRLFLIS